MAISTSLSENKQKLQQAHQRYQQDVVFVTWFCASVLASSLPALNENPDNWKEITTAYDKANSDALVWANTALAQLISTPEEVNQWNDSITSALQDALSNTTTLVSNPNDNTARTNVYNDLKQLSSDLGLVVGYVEGMVTTLDGFQSGVSDMATQFATIVQDSIDASNADQQQIDNLNDSIADLNNSIKNYWIAIGVAAGVAVLNVIVAVVATIADWPEGATIWMETIPAVLLAGGFILVQWSNIQTAKQSIEGDQKEITGITADMGALSALSQQYSTFSTQAVQVQNTLTEILSVWQVVQTAIEDAANEITTGGDDFGTGQWQDLENDLNTALTDWQEAYGISLLLTFNIQASNADVNLNMSQDDFEAAINNGTNTPIIQYLNSL